MRKFIFFVALTFFVALPFILMATPGIEPLDSQLGESLTLDSSESTIGLAIASMNEATAPTLSFLNTVHFTGFFLVNRAIVLGHLIFVESPNYTNLSTPSGTFTLLMNGTETSHMHGKRCPFLGHTLA